jgi:glutathione S-transferase
MMILRSTPPSPFGRKVKIAASLLGLAAEIDVQATDTANPADTVRQQNPLGKIPVLIVEDGTCYYDSRVILEYLDHRAGGGKIIPRESMARFAALRLQALCDGTLDACILQIYETRFRPAEHRVPSWMAYQAEKVTRSLAALEAAPPGLDATPNVGQITLACVLGYRDLRFEGAWRKDHPGLVAWLDQFAAQVPAFENTKVVV